MAHDAAHAHESHAQDSHGSHGHDTHGGHGAADIADGPTSGPFGWPFALLVGIGTLGLTLWAFMAH